MKRKVGNKSTSLITVLDRQVEECEGIKYSRFIGELN